MVAYFRKSTKKIMAKKRPAYRKKAPYVSVARQVQSILARQVETKSHISIVTERAISSLGSPILADPLNLVGQGTTQSTRCGQKIMPKFIDVRGHVHLATTAEPQFVKLLLVSCDDGDDGLTDILENNTSLLAPSSQDVSSIYARVNTTKYKVLGSKVIKVGPSNNYYGTHLFHMKAKLSGVMNYDQGATVPTHQKLLFIAWNRRADNDETTGTSAEITYNSKFYFTDM